VLRCAVEVVELLAGHNTLYSQLQGVSNQLTKFRAHLSACLLFSTLANLNITPTTRVYDYDIYINIYIVISQFITGGHCRNLGRLRHEEQIHFYGLKLHVTVLHFRLWISPMTDL
jgi:hypothetical protein